MDALKGLVAGQGCSADGVAAAHNPLSRAVSGLAASLPAPDMGAQRYGHARYEMAGSGPHPDDFAAQSMRQASARGAMPSRGAMHAAWARSSGPRGAVAMPARAAARGSMGDMEAAWAERRAAEMHRHAMARGAMMGHGPMPGAHMMARPPAPPGMMMMGGGGMMMHGAPPMHMMHRGAAAAPAAAVAAPAPAAATAKAKAAPPAGAVTAEPAASSSWASQLAPATTVEVVDVTGATAEAAARPVEDDAARTREASKRLAEALAKDPTFKDSSLRDFMSKVGGGELEIADNSVVEGRAAPMATAAPAPATSSTFESAWADSMTADDEIDFGALWAGMKEAIQDPMDRQWWENSGLAQSAGGQWVQPEEAEYKVASLDDNPYREAPDAFKNGMELFDKGKLHEAVQAFEVVVSKDKEHSEAWRMLGMCHAENDEDKKAILCLERAVEEDPYNLDAQVALGVSYVNELDYDKALAALKSWVTHNPKFHGLKIEDTGDDAYGAPDSKLDSVMHLMLRAVAWDGGDPEVQVVLGVLYNVSRDFDSAIKAFQAAVDAKPDDYSLWNKLGATRANSNRSEEALPAYRRALELKPTYARGWLNLGISHANLGQYADAARAYITALQLNPGATHIWTYLRIALTCLQRSDLVALTDTEDVSLLKKIEL